MAYLRIVLSPPEALARFRECVWQRLGESDVLSAGARDELRNQARALGVHALDCAALLDEVLAERRSDKAGRQAAAGLASRIRAGDAQALSALLAQARQGGRHAQHALGDLYRRGAGMARDDAAAAEWYGRAAAQGYAPAQYALGWMFAEGRGVERSDRQAGHWWEQAAARGHRDAQAALQSLQGSRINLNDNEGQS